jgi:hypothetical protein
MTLLVGVVKIRGNQRKEAKIGFGRKEEKRRRGVSPGIVQRGKKERGEVVRVRRERERVMGIKEERERLRPDRM